MEEFRKICPMPCPDTFLYRAIRTAVPATMLSIALGPHVASAQTYDPYAILGAFNVIVSGTYSSKNDIEGRAIIGTLDGTQNSQQIFASNAKNTDASPTLTDSATNTPTTFGTLNVLSINSNVAQVTVAAGTFADIVSNRHSVPITVNGGTVKNTPYFNMSAFTTPLNQLQVSLGHLATTTTNFTFATSGANNPLTFNLGSNSSAIDVFSITTAQLHAATTITFNGIAQSVVVNVAGTNFDDVAVFTPLKSSSSIAQNALVWNFTNAATLNFTNWQGSVLAGQATVTNNNPIEGNLYAANFIGSGEVHDFPFQPSTPPTVTPPPTTPPPTSVPEPTAALLLASGLMGLFGFGRRRTTTQTSSMKQPSI